MTIRQFEHFLEIVRFGSINGAAESMGITQQSLLASVNSLEKALGFSVLKRSHNGVALTPRGEAVLGDMKKIVALAMRWEKLREADDSVPIVIPVAGTISMVNLILEPVAALFKVRHPRVSLEIHEIRRMELVSLVLHDYMIGVFGAIPPADLDDTRESLARNGMEMEVLGRDDYALILNASHPLAGMEQVRRDMLSELVPAMYPKDREQFCYAEIYRSFSEAAAPYYFTKQESILRRIVSNPSVAAVFPRSAAANGNVAAGSLKAVPVEDFPMPGCNCMVYPSRERLSMLESDLVDEIRKAAATIHGTQPAGPA